MEEIYIETFRNDKNKVMDTLEDFGISYDVIETKSDGLEIHIPVSIEQASFIAQTLFREGLCLSENSSQIYDNYKTIKTIIFY